MADANKRQKCKALKFNPGHFSTVVSGARSAWRWLGWKSFRFSKPAHNAFLLSSDLAAHCNSLGIDYEPENIELLKKLADGGYDDALVDIGANVGLISIGCYDAFARIYCFEANPLLWGVLETNLAINECFTTVVKKFGLANRESETTLVVPRRNWGGGHVIEGNGYDRKVLESKEGGAAALNNSFNISVELKSARIEFMQIFDEIRKADSNHRDTFGIAIKVDVEGYEVEIINEVLAIAPADFRIAIFFENLNDQLPVQCFTDNGRNVEFYSFNRTLSGWSEHIKFYVGGVVSMLIRGVDITIEKPLLTPQKKFLPQGHGLICIPTARNRKQAIE